MIRILHVVTYMGRGGLETMLMNYYRHIDRDRIQFDFLVHREFEADYDKEIESLGGRIYKIQKLNPFSNKYKKSLRTFFLIHPEYKIVHVHQDCLSSVILKVAKECNVPVRIAHSHNSNQAKDIRYPVKLYYKRWIAKYATALFACGADAGDWMFGGVPYTIVKNSIDAKRFLYNKQVRDNIRHQMNISHSFVVGNVANFSVAKNHIFLIDIFNEIQKKKENSVLLLVGDGPTINEAKNKVRALGLENKVLFAGVCGNVSELMQAMDVFVMPSLYEGLPLVLVEAQAAGLNCIISDNVPDDCKITKLVTKISLTESAEKWADTILSYENCQREDTYETIYKAGFDIVDNAVWLQEYYFKSMKEGIV